MPLKLHGYKTQKKIRKEIRKVLDASKITLLQNLQFTYSAAYGLLFFLLLIFKLHIKSETKILEGRRKVNM